MKKKMIVALAAMAAVGMVGGARAATFEPDQDSSTVGKMFHKLGRGVVNVFTCWVEVPRHIAHEWERTDPVTGIFLGTATGVGWGAARLATGLYETVTFPMPVPANYEPMLLPEFVVSDTWGDPIPELTDLHSNDTVPGSTTTHPDRFRF